MKEGRAMPNPLMVERFYQCCGLRKVDSIRMAVVDPAFRELVKKTRSEARREAVEVYGGMTVLGPPQRVYGGLIADVFSCD